MEFSVSKRTFFERMFNGAWMLIDIVKSHVWKFSNHATGVQSMLSSSLQNMFFGYPITIPVQHGLDYKHPENFNLVVRSCSLLKTKVAQGDKTLMK